jgi:hypothetical protein
MRWVSLFFLLTALTLVHGNVPNRDDPPLRRVGDAQRSPRTPLDLPRTPQGALGRLNGSQSSFTLLPDVNCRKQGLEDGAPAPLACRR